MPSLSTLASSTTSASARLPPSSLLPGVLLPWPTIQTGGTILPMPQINTSLLPLPGQSHPLNPSFCLQLGLFGCASCPYPGPQCYRSLQWSLPFWDRPGKDYIGAHLCSVAKFVSFFKVPENFFLCMLGEGGMWVIWYL